MWQMIAQRVIRIIGRTIARNPAALTALGSYGLNVGRTLAQQAGQQWVRYVVLPFAMVVGAIGVYAEEKLMPAQKPLPYLEHTRLEERMNRLLAEDISPEMLQARSLAEEKSKIVPKSSLVLNQPRNQVESPRK